ncbi:MAG: hypothetical protein NT136_01675 [Candidatus Moranbacteria bacterium]|nr:hypothetical protein [Candidatus Moranbacteria bacterium]
MSIESPENLSSQYEKEVRMQKEIEKIELISTKLKEKYSPYQELVEFVDYLRSAEEVFIEARVKSWSDDQTKEDLIKKEIYLMSLETGVDDKVFRAIYDDFHSLYASIGQVYSVTEKLLEKYKDCKECQEFIHYLGDISLIFLEAEKEGLALNEAKERLFKARMKVLSVDGQPELGVLEKIYEEFKKELNR